MTDIEGAIVPLEGWIERLERAYLDAAVRASELDLERDADALERNGELLDRIEANADRARKAIEIWRRLVT